MAREITKAFEDILAGAYRGSRPGRSRTKPPRGEITLLIAPPDGQTQHAGGEQASAETVPLARHVEAIMRERGLDRKAALKQAARERGLTRREAYKQLLITRDE